MNTEEHPEDVMNRDQNTEVILTQESPAEKEETASTKDMEDASPNQEPIEISHDQLLDDPKAEEEKKVIDQEAEKEDGVQLKKDKRKSKLIISLLGVAVLLATIFGIKMYSDDQAYTAYVEEYNLYLSRIRDTQMTMLDGGVDSESVLHDFTEVWYNAIWKKDSPTTDKYTKIDGVFVNDFNLAISAYHIDNEVSKKMSGIQTNQTKVDESMKKLKTVPKGLEEHYSAISKLYDIYTEFTELALHPTGSLKTFQEASSLLNSQFLTHFNKVDKLDFTKIE